MIVSETELKRLITYVPIRANLLHAYLGLVKYESPVQRNPEVIYIQASGATEEEAKKELLEHLHETL